MSEKTNNSVRVSPEAVENLEALEAYGFDIPQYEIIEEPEDERIYMETKTMKKETPIDLEAIFELDEDAVEEEIEEEVEFNETEQAMIDLLKEKSRELSQFCFYIERKDGEGIEFGNFNGAGDRAITMYQPEHPDAPKSGKNYGKMFYRWTNEVVKDVLYGIFEQAKKNRKMHEILFGKKEEGEKAVEEE